MTRRERILTALRGGYPDRPPIAFDVRGDALRGALEYFGARDRKDLYRVTGIDGFSVWDWNAVMGCYTKPTRTAPDGTPYDFWGNVSQHAFGLAGCDTVAALQDHAWPRVEDFDFSHIPAVAQSIQDQDMVVAAGHVGLGYQMHNMLRGNEAALLDLTDPDYMACYLEHLARFAVEYLTALLTAGSGRIEVVRADDDVGTMDRLMISPAMWRRYYKPAWKRAFDIIHAHGAKVWFHSCGYIEPLLQDLVEIGVDCWNPFPDYVRGNDHARLKEFRRGRLALDGGVNHFTLVRGRPADVREATRRVLDTFAAEGGLLIGPSQVFTEDMPAANIVALLETALAGR